MIEYTDFKICLNSWRDITPGESVEELLEEEDEVGLLATDDVVVPSATEDTCEVDETPTAGSWDDSREADVSMDEDEASA